MTKETLEKAKKISSKIHALSDIKESLEKQLATFQRDPFDAHLTRIRFVLRGEGIEIGHEDLFHRDFIHFLGDLISTATQEIFALQKEFEAF